MHRKHLVKGMVYCAVICCIAATLLISGCSGIATNPIYEKPEVGTYTKTITVHVVDGDCSYKNEAGFYKRKGINGEVCISRDNPFYHPQEIGFEELGLHAYRHIVGLPMLRDHIK